MTIETTFNGLGMSLGSLSLLSAARDMIEQRGRFRRESKAEAESSSFDSLFWQPHCES
jgi:hypothetical protein